MKPRPIKPFVLALTLAFAGVGLAHSELTGSTPKDSETLRAAPSEVTLNFSEALETRFSIFKVYPLGADVDERESDKSAENARLRTNGLAGQLVGEVLEAQGSAPYLTTTSVKVVTIPTMLRLSSLILLFTMPLAFAQNPLPECGYEDRPATLTSYDAWPDTLLDTLYTLPEDYAPSDLEPVSSLGVGSDATQLRSFVLPDLKALLAAAEAAEMGLEVQSAYRSYSYQIDTFNRWVDVDGYAAALKSSARPGHSEHQLGTALDFRSADGPPAWELDDWAETPEGAWLAQHAAEFGFVMSYPKGKEALTCYIYEPWHYRYVGREEAAEVATSGLTLREWLWQR